MKMLCLLLSTFIIGCSFSKNMDESQTSQRVDMSQPLSDYQVSILSAVRDQNVATLQRVLTSARDSDLVFSQNANTPMSLAIENNDLEVAKILLDKKVDIYNFGIRQREYEKSILKHSLSILEKRNDATAQVEETVLGLVSLNISKFFIESISSEASIPNVRKLRSLGLSCDVFEKFIILAIQSDVRLYSGRTKVIDYLKTLNCEYIGGDLIIQRMYEHEVLHQTANHFSDTTLLTYLSNHRGLVNPMVELLPGLFLSPKLFYRISHSHEANFPGSYSEGATSEQAFTSYKIRQTKYELVRVSNGEVNMAFRIFPYLQSIAYADETIFDVFFDAVFKFVTGNDQDLLGRVLNERLLQFRLEHALPFHPSMLSLVGPVYGLTDIQRMYLERGMDYAESSAAPLSPYPLEEQVESEKDERYVPSSSGGGVIAYDLPDPNSDLPDPSSGDPNEKDPPVGQVSE